MRNWKRFSIRSMLILMVLVSGVLWLFLPLIRGDAYAEFTVLDVAITPKNEIQIVVDSKKTRNCTIGLSAPSSPIVGATQEPWFVFPGWPENPPSVLHRQFGKRSSRCQSYFANRGSGDSLGFEKSRTAGIH